MEEQFTEDEQRVLESYVTNPSGSVFALKNLPEVIKGALFSRYSRSILGLRQLLLKEFVQNAEEKAQDFYDRILDGYGDDSIGELGGAHIAMENISMLAAKAVEDLRIGGSPLEKSTRYIYFDQKKGGEYAFYREPVIMTSAFRDLYVQTCNRLFETYSALVPELTTVMEGKFPKDPVVSQGAYNAAIRAKVLDCLRGLLPAATFTNVGVFGNGRFFEHLLQKLQHNHLAEMRELGVKATEELSKLIPSFVRRAREEHRHFQGMQAFRERIHGQLQMLAAEHKVPERLTEGVTLIDYDEDDLYKVAAALLFSHTQSPLSDLEAYVRTLPKSEIERILEGATLGREHRRHKSPRALERASFTFEITADFGIYRDLHRHRMLTQERQLLDCRLGYAIPEEILKTKMEKPYREAMDLAKEAFEKIARELPEEAQYVVPMAYNIRWYMHINLRALQWLTELRSAPQGHPAYRRVAQALAHATFSAVPEFRKCFQFVDFDGYDLGRLDQEIRNERKVTV